MKDKIINVIAYALLISASLISGEGLSTEDEMAYPDETVVTPMVHVTEWDNNIDVEKRKAQTIRLERLYESELMAGAYSCSFNVN